MIAIIDTNVLAAGLITRRPESPTAVIVDSMLRGRFRFALSEDLLSEYRRALLYPKLVRRHGLDPNQVDGLLADLTVNALIRKAPASDVVIPDPGDAFLFHLLAVLSNGVLVTGDQRLLTQATAGARVLAPVQFVEHLPA